MLMDERFGEPFDPNLNYFISAFSVYDREELEDFLNKYDPNVEGDRKVLAKYAIDRLSYIRTRLSYRHAYALVSELEKALKNKKHDFTVYFKEDEDDCCYFPSMWNIQDPRAYFEEVLNIVKNEWKEDLEKASKEDPSTW